MSTYRIAILGCVALGGLVSTVAACSDEASRPGAMGSLSGTGGSAGTGGSGGSTSAGGTAGTAGSGNPGGQGGGAGTAGTAGASDGGSAGEGGSGGDGGSSQAVCGDGVIAGDEECDQGALGGRDCVSLGFDGGALVCDSSCELDTSGCTGTERCYDGLDNDADGTADCDDPDCSAGCSDPCAAPVVLDDPGSLDATTFGRPDLLASSCIPASGGSELVFRFVPVHTGALDVIVESAGPDLVVSARTQCDQVAAEVACADASPGPAGTERLLLEANEGEAVYVVVDGTAANQSGGFTISASSRPVQCGDGHRDPGEECDDGGTSPGDGCSPQCVLEPSETEPNGSSVVASAYVDGFVGSIDPTSDVDVVRVTVSHAISNITVDTFDLGDGACSQELMDPAIRLLAADGVTVLAEDDDSGAGYCAHAAVGNLDPGEYFIEVRRAGAGSATFPYFLSAAVDWCGNGVRGEAEECDDGNVTPGDGCQADCTL